MGESRNDKVRKSTFLCLTFCIHQVTDGPALHKNDGMVTVLSHGGGGKAINIFCFNRFQNFLKGECRYMMAFIYDDHSIVCDEGLDTLFFSLEKRLHNGDINDPAVSIFSRSDLSDETTLLFPAAFFGQLR